MECGTDGQGARDSLSPMKGPWVFTALGTVCELRPPYSLHSLQSQPHPPQPPAPERFSFHVAAENRALYKCSSDLSKNQECWSKGWAHGGANAYPGAVPRALGRDGLFCCLHPGTSHYIQKQQQLAQGAFPNHNYLGQEHCSPLESTAEGLQHSVADHRKRGTSTGTSPSTSGSHPNNGSQFLINTNFSSTEIH